MKPMSSEKTVQVKVHEGSPGGSETTGVGFVKQVGFKPGVSKIERELWVYRVVNQKRKQ